MEYINITPEKHKLYITRLEKIVLQKRFPVNLLKSNLEKDYTIGDFLAERIELLNKSTIYKKIDKDSVREEVFYSDDYIKNHRSGAAVTFDFFGKLCFDMAVKENDHEWMEISMKSFSNVITCYKGLGKDVEKTKFLLNQLPLLKDMVSTYFIEYSHSKSIDKILDYINCLKGIKNNSKKAEEIKNRIYENCQLIPKNDADKIYKLMDKILNNK